jgi:hypothetical protein
MNRKKTIILTTTALMALVALLMVIVLWRNNPSTLPEALGGSEFTSRERSITENNPILKGLPYDGYTFQIDYGRSRLRPLDDSAFSIIVSHSDDQGKFAAIETMKQYGFNLSEFEVYYSSISPASNLNLTEDD